ncbi:MAG: ABC transporter permease, partial [Pseudomonadota bacterium]
RLFILMLLFGIFNVIGGIIASTSDVFGIDSYPTTLRVLTVINGGFALSLIVVIVFYAGELVHRERQTGVANFLDALPFPNWAIMLAKLIALMLVIATMQLVILIAAALYQLYRGYFEIELGHMFQGLFLYFPLSIWLYAVLAIFLQVVINQKYVAMFVSLLYVVCQIFLPQQGFDQMLYLYATPVPAYSAFTGFSLGLDAFVWFSLYWGCFSVILLLLCDWLWQRGSDTQWRGRLKMARQRMGGTASVLMVLCLLGFSSLGGFIYYNTNILNPHYSQLDLQRLQAEYEKRYKRYQDMPQPEIETVSVEVAIFPEDREVEATGRYSLINRNDVAIDKIYVALLPDITINKITIDGATLTESDRLHGHFAYSLANPLQPGEKRQMDFDVAWRTPGFVNRAPVPELLDNGTFFTNVRAFPGIGYNVSAELLDNSIRRRHGLGDVERARKIDDVRGLQQSALGAPRVAFEATVSTSFDQVAVAPGYLVREWEEDNRRYFHYKMDAPIWNFTSFMSAKYKVQRDKWNDIDIEVYHRNPVNVDRMISSIKKSLAYFEKNFSPYQYRQFRIFEFPAVRGQFAQSFPNTVPFSESIGFTTDVRNPARIDLPFYVTAHEIAHQWWGHQIAGANVQGVSMIVESLAQYSALMVMEEEYGRPYMQRFLKTELDRYLNGRGGELLEELPLSLVENQPYIHYRKGSLAFYALKDRIGADKLNAALSQFLKDRAFGSAPYPTTRDLLAEIRKQAGPESTSFIDDLFDRIVLYDLKTESASYTVLPDGRFEVTLELSAKKFLADGQGKESQIPIDGIFDIAVLGDKPAPGQPPEVLFIDKYELNEEALTLQLIVDKKPVSAGIDPFNIMIDRLPDDNVKAVEVVDVQNKGDVV